MEGRISHMLVTNSPEETIAAGELLGGLLKPGDVVALTGELGAGKTVMAKGIAAGLGFDKTDMVTSPTYKILNQYQGRVIINHFDAYRLESATDFMDVGGGDLIGKSAVSVIEWAERVADALPPGAIWVNMLPRRRTGREIEFDIPESRKDITVMLASTHA